MLKPTRFAAGCKGRTISRTTISKRPSPACSFEPGGVAFSREVFSSAPHQVIAVRLSASRPGSLSFTMALDTPLHFTVRAVGRDGLRLSGKAPTNVDPN